MYLGSNWLAHAYLGETGLAHAMVSLEETILVSAIDLSSKHCVTKGNFLPVAFHFLTSNGLGLGILVYGHWLPKVNFLPVGLHWYPTLVKIFPVVFQVWFSSLCFLAVLTEDG